MPGGPSAEEIREFEAVGGELWVAVEGDRAAFTLLDLPRSDTGHRRPWLRLPPDTVCLENSATSPRDRGRGIAPAAWSAIADALEREVASMITKVAVDNVPSRRAVTMAGFQEVALMRLVSWAGGHCAHHAAGSGDECPARRAPRPLRRIAPGLR